MTSEHIDLAVLC